MAKFTEHVAPKNAVFVYSPSQLTYKFSDEHPFNQKRLELTMDLLTQIGALCDNQIVPPRQVTDDELLLMLDADYIDIVKRAGHGYITNAEGEPFGIGTEDTPIFPNMHEASAGIVAATLTACRARNSGAL